MMTMLSRGVFLVIIIVCIMKSSSLGAGVFVPEMFAKFSESISNARCKAQLDAFKLNVNNATLWAMQMLDASAKVPPGILVGSSIHLGNFDECMSINTGHIMGKYCLAAVELSTNQQQPACNPAHASQCSAWKTLEVAERMKIRRNRLRLAICVPSGCSASDLEQGLGFLTTEFPSMTIRIRIEEEMCQTQEGDSRESVNNFWYVVLFYLLFLASCELKMWMNVVEVNSRPRWYAAFSVRSQCQQLLSLQRSATSVTCIDGLRALLILLIVAGHRSEALLSGPLVNANAVDEMYDDFLSIILMNSHFIVDVFFVISGFLVCKKLIWYFEMKDRPNIILVHLFRYTRLMPVFAAIILFEMFALYDLSNGPLWPEKVGKERLNCRNNWWTNFLFVNNYVESNNTCVDPAWYIACDTQLYFLAPIIVYMINKWPKYDWHVLYSTLTISILIPFTITYVGDFDPTLITDPVTLQESTHNRSYLAVYVTAYCRAGPYVVGIMFSYWLHKMQTNNTQMPRIVVWLGWTLGPLLQVAMLTSAVLVYDANSILHTSPLLTALYAALHRTVFSLGIGFFITACARGDGGIFNKVLSWNMLLPMSRLSYSIYLCHKAVQMFHFASARSQMYTSFIDMIWLSLGDIVLSTVIATVLYVTVERPVIGIIDVVLFGDRQNKSSENVDMNVQHSSNCKAREVEHRRNEKLR